jgi:hypothetical protein
MPDVTESCEQLTFLPNCFTMGLLEITYPAGHPSRRAADP